ncbi:hypothetical protein GQ53DRAFT_882733 [Thozetella sp. PMI_491]|nr:hypothetical protein GQ53DRAFT_882733 [Thozetella sp. PMI_491]
MSTNRGPWRLLTVNTAPERAKRLIGQMIQALENDYDIEHIGNCENIDEVAPKVTANKPNVIFCASMWTAEQANEIFGTAKSIVPDIKTHAIPTGLQVEKGPDAVVEYLVREVPKLLQ